MLGPLFGRCWGAVGGRFGQFFWPVCAFVVRYQGFGGRWRRVSIGRGCAKAGGAPRLMEWVGGMAGPSKKLLQSYRQGHPEPTLPR